MRGAVPRRRRLLARRAGVVSAFEHGYALLPVLDRIGVADPGLLSALAAALDSIRSGALARCPGSGPAAELTEGLAYAEELKTDIGEYNQALTDCGVGILISPTNVKLVPGAQQQFTFSFPDAGSAAVTFSASAGSITAEGLYTAPAEEGTYQVTATRAGTPARSATATVVVAACPG